MINIYLRRSHATKTLFFFFVSQRQIGPSIRPPLPSDVP